MQPVAPDDSLLFLSDAHLGGFSPGKNREIERQLIHLIDYCQHNRIKICVLGDLFDYWMEYPDHIPRVGKQVRDRFEKFNHDLGPTLYITGNHDNWTRSYFHSIGFTLEHEYRTLTLGGQKLLLLHGDGLLNSRHELRRPLLHRMLRNKTFITYYQKIFPPAAGLWLMKWFSRLNRLWDEHKQDIAIMNEWAEMTLENSDFDLIICGHDHLPRKHEFRFGTYLNLGTFYNHGTCVFYNNHSFELVVWNDATNQLNNYYPAVTSHERQ